MLLIIFIYNHNFVQIVQPYKQAQRNCNAFFFYIKKLQIEFIIIIIIILLLLIL